MSDPVFGLDLEALAEALLRWLWGDEESLDEALEVK